MSDDLFNRPPEPPRLSPALDRIPPQSLDGEQAALGCCLIDSTHASIETVRDILAPADFYRDAHRRIYEAILHLDDAEEPVDVLTVANELERIGALDQAGGRAYLFACVDVVPAVSRCATYCERVEATAILRQLIDAGGEIIGMAYDQELTADEILALAEKRIFALGQRRRRGQRPVLLKEILPEVQDQIDLAASEGSRIQGVPTGFAKLDELLSGLQRGDLTLAAGRPSMGKTAMALNVLANSCVAGTVGLLFSLEMTRHAVARRLLSYEVSIDGARLRSGDLRCEPDVGDEFVTVLEGIVRMNEWPIWIDDKSDRTLMEMRSLGRQWKQDQNIGLVVVDYADLMVREVPPDRTRHELGRIAAGMKAMAKELDVAVLLLCQLSRETERRASKRPQMSDLAECGYLERDADTILFPFRPAVYDSDAPLYGPDVERAEIIIGKQRNGPTGTANVLFARRHAAFMDEKREGGE